MRGRFPPPRGTVSSRPDNPITSYGRGALRVRALGLWIGLATAAQSSPAAGQAPQPADEDGAITQPTCRPAWWNNGDIARAVGVELAAATSVVERVRFYVDPPCINAATIRVQVSANQAIRERTIDLTDMRVAVRPRAIALAVGALLSESSVAEYDAADESREVSSEPMESGDSLAAPPSEDLGSRPPHEQSPRQQQPLRPQAEAGATASQAGDVSDSADHSGAPAATQTDSSPSSDTEAPRIEAPAPQAGMAPRVEPAAWSVELNGLGALSRGPAPWSGPGVGLSWRPRPPLRARLGADFAFAARDDALGTVSGRWLGTAAEVGLETGVLQRWVVGAAVGVALDWIRLVGSTVRADVATDARSTWSVSFQLSGRLEMVLAPHVGAFVDVGLRLHAGGLSATSPTGRVLAVERISGVGRIGVVFYWGDSGGV